MNMKKTGFRINILGALLVMFIDGAAAGQGSLPAFYINDQSLSAPSVFSPDTDVFSLGGLEDLVTTPYKANFESISGTAIGFFTVLTLDTPFSPLEPSMALSGNFFGGSASSASFDFMTTPNKYHVAVVSGFGGGPTAGTRYNLHVTPIPEAEVWGMMLVGLGLLGVMTRRQRKTAANA